MSEVDEVAMTVIGEGALRRAYQVSRSIVLRLRLLNSIQLEEVKRLIQELRSQEAVHGARCNREE
ncbi:hypothetical protein PHLCEN_2v2778 [Hermanssonia centrifuga]|uniref:Uncharacterized protein n=1 Tax=Hermanssonia centrifuga TaxID=98765 RepID=A0A2R6RHW9_9APHY|nr:hypothetical protein PHLCEN_2v2778 [Hermanssonia centrifuga]